MNVHEKILQLRKMAPENGATEAEAIAALELANKLMEKHGITEQELKQVQFAKDMKSGTVDNKKKSEDPAAKLCAVHIARFCEVKVWSDFDEDMLVTRFFGLNGDVEMAEFLYEVIRKAMEKGWQDYLKRGDHPNINKHKLYWSYRYGFADRINGKLQEMIDARQPKGEMTGVDLVVLKQELVEQAAREMMPDIDLRPVKNVGVKIHTRAYAEGAADGDRVNLNRPLQDGENIKALK